MSYKTIAVHLDAGPRCATRVVVEEAVDAVVSGGVTRDLLRHMTVPTLLSH